MEIVIRDGKEMKHDRAAGTIGQGAGMRARTFARYRIGLPAGGCDERRSGYSSRWRGAAGFDSEADRRIAARLLKKAPGGR